MAQKRNFLTGEWETFEDTGKREVIVYSGTREVNTCSAICSKRPHVSRSGAVNPAQAAEFTAAARRAGITGVTYCPKTGNLLSSSRESRRREARRRSMYDNG